MENGCEVGVGRIERDSPNPEKLGDVDIKNKIRRVVSCLLRKAAVSPVSFIISDRPRNGYAHQ